MKKLWASGFIAVTLFLLPGDLRALGSRSAVPQVEQDEVVAGTFVFCESHLHLF